MVEAMGMTAEQASKLAIQSKLNGKGLEENNKAILAGARGSASANKSGMLQSKILADVSNISEDIALIYLGYPEKLGDAAQAASAIGTNLAGVQKIANSLLNFESSIAAEMEAELLTGKSLNLEKARELALNNDLAGVAKELGSQGITSTSFSKLNAIQQRAQAKALGMSTQGMSKMLMQQSLSLNMSTEGLGKQEKAALEDMKRQDASEKMGKAIDKMSQALAPIVGMFADLLTPILGIVSQTWVVYTTLGLIAAYKIGANFGTAIKGLKGIKDGALGAFKSLKKLG
jgi:hypothetical protein